MNLVLILLVGRALVRREGQMRLLSLRGDSSRGAARVGRQPGLAVGPAQYGAGLHVSSVGADNLHVVEPMVTRTRRFLPKIGPLKAAYHGVRGWVMADLSMRSPGLLSRLRYREAWGRWPDLENPITFDEKLLWLNLHWHHPLKVECGDKYTMRGYVEREGLGHLLPRAYSVYDSVDAIDFRSLPDRFVLKCTHGAKSNVFCHNKAELDVERARQDLRRWMATDFSRFYGEAHYAQMTPRILCEEFLDDGTGLLPTDYKVYCFNGRPCYVLCCFDRVPNGKASLAVADLDWNPVVFYRDEPPGGRPMPRPAALPEILGTCERLSSPFPFVRVDFYSIRGRAVLGELTFTPDACIDATYTDEAEADMGRRLMLPQPYVA